MKNEYKPYFRKAVYLVGTTVALSGILIMTAKMFPKVKMAELKNETKMISELKVADMKFSNTTKTTSRGSDETRTSEKVTNNTQENKNSTKAETTKKSETNNKKNNDTTKSASTTKNTTKKTSSAKKSTASSSKAVKVTGLNISKNMDLTVRTGLSRDEFIKLIAKLKVDTSGFFEKNAGTIYDLCEKYSINEIFFCGLISAESGWNIASNHRRTHNYISLMYKGKLISYGSVNEGLEVAAQKLHKNYLTPGGAFYHGKTLAGVKTCFCPSGTWVDLVYGRMKQIVK